jgi:hypothetical protein
LKQSRGRRGRRVVVDTSVVISGIAAFKGSFVEGRTDGGDLLYHWLTRGKLTWLVTPEILEEYREVANRLRVRRSVAGRMTNLLKEEAKEVVVERIFEISPDQATIVFARALRRAQRISWVRGIQPISPRTDYLRRSCRPLSFFGYSASGPGHGDCGQLLAPEGDRVLTS